MNIFMWKYLYHSSRCVKKMWFSIAVKMTLHWCRTRGYPWANCIATTKQCIPLAQCRTLRQYGSLFSWLFGDVTAAAKMTRWVCGSFLSLVVSVTAIRMSVRCGQYVLYSQANKRWNLWFVYTLDEFWGDVLEATLPPSWHSPTL